MALRSLRRFHKGIETGIWARKGRRKEQNAKAIKTRLVHSTELRIGSGLPGTQDKKDDSGSYINDVISQRKVDLDSAPGVVR